MEQNPDLNLDPKHDTARANSPSSDIDLSSQLLEQYNQGDRSTDFLLQFAQTLQRKGRFLEATRILDDAINNYPIHGVLKHLHARAQILASQQRWADAAHDYMLILQYEINPQALKNHRIELAHMLRNDYRVDEARRVLDEMIQENPDDLRLLHIRRSLDQPIVNSSVGDSSPARPYRRCIHLSRLIECELQRAEFQDPAILAKNGQPDYVDALRLLRLLNESKDKPLEMQFPLYLEVAKAFFELSEGACDPAEHLLAFARFALVRCNSLLKEFKALLLATDKSGQVIPVRDTFFSFLLAAAEMRLQISRFGLEDHQFVWTCLTYYLRVSLAMDFPDRFAWIFSSSFATLFKFCFDSKPIVLAETAWRALVAFVALNRRFLSDIKPTEELRGVMCYLESHAQYETQTRQILGRLRGASADSTESTLELFKTATDTWKSRRHDIEYHFAAMECLDLETRGLTPLIDLWGRHPMLYGYLFTSTDIELLLRIKRVMETLTPYYQRSASVQTEILTKSLRLINDIIAQINLTPTHWGRTRFEPLLIRLRTAVTKFKRQQGDAIAPRLRLALEPPVFQLDDGVPVGGLKVSNDGERTETHLKLELYLWSGDGDRMLWRSEAMSIDEIGAGESRYIPLRLPLSALPEDISKPHQIRVSMIDGSAALRTAVEISPRIQIPPETIPWNETLEPTDKMFKGREEDIANFQRHFQSSDRAKSYMLIGLTRTGKSSLLRHLSRRMHLKPTGDGAVRFFCVEWDFAKAANLKRESMWRSFLVESVLKRASRCAEEGQLDKDAVPKLRNTDEPDFEDWDEILRVFKEHQLYPVFLIDEFTYYRELHGKGNVGPSFLAAIRGFAIDGLASFIFAGTYDLRELIYDSQYNITAQLVNVEERRISQIDEQSARSLIVDPMPSLKFTADAIQYVLELSFQIPYFIQVVCNRIALAAAMSGRSHVGYLDVDGVVQCLSGEVGADQNLGINALGPNVFVKNMYDPDRTKKHCHALLTTLCDRIRGQHKASAMTLSEIKIVWQRHGVPDSDRLVAEALKELVDRQIVVEHLRDGRPEYQISVDLFRRWWANEHRILDTDLDLLKTCGSNRKEGNAS